MPTRINKGMKAPWITLNFLTQTVIKAEKYLSSEATQFNMTP
jgi:hypothetical protein